MSKPIFISYRRKLSSAHAKVIQLLLDKFFDDAVFLDVRDVEPGDKWPVELQDAVDECQIMLVLIPEEWFTYKLDGQTELDDSVKAIKQKGDWVRNELISAIKGKKTIIPLLIDQSDWPDIVKKFPVKAFPKDIRSIYNNDQRYCLFIENIESDFQKVIDKIAQHVPKKKNASDHGELASYSELLNELLAIEFPLPVGTKMEFKSGQRRIPYIGLRPFTELEAPIFFGRSREIYDFYKLLMDENSQDLFLLHGYSGTGKSSFLKAGIKLRLASIDWEIEECRREEDMQGGLPALFDKLKGKIKPERDTLLVFDQLEEAITNPIEEISQELNLFYKKVQDLLNSAELKQGRKIKILLSYRSEYHSRFINMIGDAKLIDHCKEITFQPLDQHGAEEAIRSVTINKSLNKNYHLHFDNRELPSRIARDILNTKDPYYVAPLLQVNMEYLWERSRKESGTVTIQSELYSEDRKVNYGAILRHYVCKVVAAKQDVKGPSGNSIDNQELEPVYRVLMEFITQKPASAVVKRVDVKQKFSGELLAKKNLRKDFNFDEIVEKLTDIYLLAETKDDTGSTIRLTHDLFAPLIYEKSLEFLNEQVQDNIRLISENFRRAKSDAERYIHQLDYDKANATVDTLKFSELSGEQPKQLFDIWLELLFVNYFRKNTSVLTDIIDKIHRSRLQVLDTVEKLQKSINKGNQEFYKAMKGMDAGVWEHLISRYFPMMVSVKPGLKFASKQTTVWQYGLYCFQTGKKLSDTIPGGWEVQGDTPVVEVDWYDAIEYANWLSGAHPMGKLASVFVLNKNVEDKNNKSKYADKKWLVEQIPKAVGYRLPTEQEWEFVAKGGLEPHGFEHAGSAKLDEVGWYSGNAGKRTMKVAQKKALSDKLPIFDLSGNVYEWCWDWYGSLPAPVPENYRGAESGGSRVMRGGSWDDDSEYCRVSYRLNWRLGLRYYKSGFRLALSL